MAPRRGVPPPSRPPERAPAAAQRGGRPVFNAAAIATLAGMAPGRVAVAIGSEFTGRYTLGQRSMRWADVAEYVRTLCALLRGDDAVWEGAVIRMIHPDGFAARARSTYRS